MSVFDEFLSRHIEGYAIYDLRSMAKCAADATTGAGAAGYPMLTTMMAAMELLGTFLCNKDIHQAVNDMDLWNTYRDAVLAAHAEGKVAPIPVVPRPKQPSGEQHFTAFWRKFM